MIDKPYKRIKIPKGLERYILQEADAGYLIYDPEDKTFTCTRCGETFKALDPPIHNNESYCIKCHSLSQIKHKRYGRKKLMEEGRILYLQKHGDTTYAELIYYLIDYKDSLPTVLYRDSDIYKFNAKIQERYIYKQRYGSHGWKWQWEKANSIKITPIFRGYGWSGRYLKTIFYKPSLKEIGTDLRYADFDICKDNYGDINPFYLIQYIYNFLKFSSFELLQKARFDAIIKNKLQGLGCRYINWRGKTLSKILKMNAEQQRELKFKNGGFSTVDLWNERKKLFPELTIKNLDLINISYYIMDYEKILGETEKYMERGVLYKYLCKNKIYLKDYLDYFSDIKKLNLDLTNRKILRPKDFVKVHAERAQQVVAAKDEIKLKEFLQNEIAKGSEYSNDKYIIRPAKSPKELQKEGEELGHCVGTYIDKVADEKCAILFVRLATEPTKPLYTLELSPHYEIRQLRGKFNKEPEDDVKQFVNSWIQWFSSNKKRKGA